MILLQWFGAILLIVMMVLVWLALWIFRPRDVRMSDKWIRGQDGSIRTPGRNQDA